MIEENIKQKSGILVWNEENIENTPNDIGVFILRSSPINGAVLFIGASTNLKEGLLKIFRENTYSETNFFDWYTTDTEEEAKLIKKDWDIKYDI